MAQLEPKIFTALTGDTGVSAIVGSRVYPVVIPQKAALPCVTYLRVSGPQEMSLSGHSGLESVRVQVDAWAESYETAKSLASAIQSALLGASTFAVTSASDRDLFEDETGVFRVSTDFHVKHRTA